MIAMPHARLTRLLRGRSPIPAADVARAGLGALLGITATGLAARAIGGGGPCLTPLLAAPIGASAVLVFAVPASPLAQPRAIIGGNMVSAVIGVSCALLLHAPVLAAGLAVALAIVVMAVLGCLHPPGGAVALGAALTAASGASVSYDYVLRPIGLCSLLLVLAGVVYHRLAGRSYPHRAVAAPSPHQTQDPPPAERFGYRPADLDAALAQYGALLDVGRDDLEALFRDVERQAQGRIHARIRCHEIMSRDVITVDVHQTARSALVYLQEHDLRSAPVIDAQRRVIGMVRRAELLAGGHRLVEAVLDPFVHRVRPNTAIDALLPLLSSGAVHEAMVVDESRVLLGVITQTDLLAVLYRAHIVESMAADNA